MIHPRNKLPGLHLSGTTLALPHFVFEIFSSSTIFSFRVFLFSSSFETFDSFGDSFIVALSIGNTSSSVEIVGQISYSRDYARYFSTLPSIASIIIRSLFTLLVKDYESYEGRNWMEMNLYTI